MLIVEDEVSILKLAKKILEEPGVHFIQKPFSRRDIAMKVREALMADD